MSVRKTFTAAFAAAVATSAVTMIASPAHAAYIEQPYDSKPAPTAADLVGGGSDTTMIAMYEVAKLWNNGAKAGYGQAFDIASFDAFGGGDIPLGNGTEILRPNGSGKGRDALIANAAMDFARSSSAISGSAAETLEGIPFALDTVEMAVSNNGGGTPSAAPASLTLAQLQSIYDCSVTNWNQVGGGNAPIRPLVPQSGSGTLSFFTSSLGVATGACVKDYIDANGNGTKDPGEASVQEHDVTAVQTDPNAIVPISKGRASLVANNPVRLVGGAQVSFKRAVYNLVRATDIAKPEIQAFFGPDGFLCSAAANEAIARGGLTQLATEANDGVCGSPADSTSNFTTNEVVASATTLTGTNLAAGVRLTATVSGSSQPTGSVSFYEGATLLQKVTVVSGQGNYVVPSPTVGAHTYKAVFTPNNAKFLGSETTTTVNYAPPATGPSPALAAALAQLDKAQTKVAKLKKQVKKAKGAKKVKAKKKLKKAKKAVKTAQAAVAAAS
ncbi:substrate-binding domain-containing protein [Nocardioides sp. BYT-33-1]|uniref:substrate-binding domain-containing protein n=1 Tax=Nocardioides sp. BYT-33-1 TaxID=3416952 RepID=UPI003F533ADC